MFVTMDEPVFIHYNLLNSLVYIKVHFFCYTILWILIKFIMTCIRYYNITQNYFTTLKTPLVFTSAILFPFSLTFIYLIRFELIFAEKIKSMSKLLFFCICTPNYSSNIYRRSFPTQLPLFCFFIL